MSTQVYEAIFQNGAFRPVRPVSIAEGQHVRLIIEVEEKPNVLELAARVYEDLSEDEVREIEHIALDRRDFFGEVS